MVLKTKYELSSMVNTNNEISFSFSADTASIPSVSTRTTVKSLFLSTWEIVELKYLELLKNLAWKLCSVIHTLIQIMYFIHSYKLCNTQITYGNHCNLATEFTWSYDVEISRILFCFRYCRLLKRKQSEKRLKCIWNEN